MKIQEKDWFIPLIYLIVSLLWIVFSDNLLYSYMKVSEISPETVVQIGKLKGFFFVVFTAVLLYFLIRKRTRSVVGVKNDFERLFENNPNAMWIYDLQSFRIVLTNKAACHQYGYNSFEFKRLSIFDLRPASEYAKLDKSLFDQAAVFSDSGDWLHQDKKGRRFFVNIFSHETLYEGKKSRLVTAIDVNKRVIAEIERDNIEKALNRAALVAIAGVDGRLQEVNNLFCNVSRYERAELIGQPVSIFNSDIEAKGFWSEALLHLKLRGSWRGDVQFTSKPGESFWLDLVLSPIKNHEGEVYRYMALGYEISDRKTLEITQQVLLDDFSEYAYQTSHELRGPLSSMLGLISIFNKFEDPAFLIEKMRDTSEKMDKVIRKMNDSLTRNSFALIAKKREVKKE